MHGVYFAQNEDQRFAGDGGFRLGVFTTLENATEQMTRLTSQPAQRALASEPGFRDTRAGFYCGQFALDIGHWCEGVVTL